MTTTPRAIPEVLEGRSLLIARVAWVVATIVIVTLVVIGFFRAYADPQLVAISAVTELFDEFGLGLRLMITLALAGPFFSVVVVGVVVFARRSNDPMALLLTATLTTSYAYVTRGLVALDGIPVLESALTVVFAIAMVLISLTLALFPNGVFLPSGSGWLAVAMTVLVISGPDTGRVLMTVIEQDAVITGRIMFLALGWAAIQLFGVVAQIWRYRTVSTLVERQQTKWVMAPLGLTIVVLVGLLLASIAIPEAPDRVAGWLIFATIPLNFLIPISFAVAVLRYRLYDIDRIISRTVGYVIVAGLLGVVYSVGAVWLPSQYNNQSPVLVAGSTLAVAALFNPVRQRALRWVDLRFYRSRFVAEKVIEELAGRLRDQTDPDVVTDEWVSAVTQTMHPSLISAWIKPASNALAVSNVN